MIKVKNNISTDKKDPLAVVLSGEGVKGHLRDLAIDLTNDKCGDFDFAIEMANDLTNPEKNTIAFERVDGCQIKNKHLLRHPNILRLVKMTYYPELGVNNLPCVDGRIFTRYLTDQRNPITDYLTAQEFNKVVAGTSFLHYKRLDKAEVFAKDNHIKKTIDVFFAGTCQYGDSNHASGQLITQHRQDCIKAIQALSDRYKVIAVQGREYSSNDYLKLLASSKITVSPWGWGESCYRDYEALMLKTDVIKPQSYKIISNPNIYTNTVYYCKPDWSNLHTVIDQCINSYDDRADDRAKTSKRLIEWRSDKAIAGIIHNIIKGCIK